tara:strand:- start:183 stop:356 length:174 start_codon:yes stop_codon:yes gene_type:complete
MSSMGKNANTLSVAAGGSCVATRSFNVTLVSVKAQPAAIIIAKMPNPFLARKAKLIN